jgi:hypothetical protein
MEVVDQPRKYSNLESTGTYGVTVGNGFCKRCLNCFCWKALFPYLIWLMNWLITGENLGIPLSILYLWSFSLRQSLLQPPWNQHKDRNDQSHLNDKGPKLPLRNSEALLDRPLLHIRTITYNDAAAPRRRMNHLIVTRLLSSSDDSTKHFSGTLLLNSQTKIMVNQNTPVTGTV